MSTALSDLAAQAADEAIASLDRAEAALIRLRDVLAAEVATAKREHGSDAE